MSVKKDKYMILCIAGQSNAVGYDESIVPPDYLRQFRRDRIRQLGLYGEDNLKVIPLGVCAQSYQDLRPYSNPGNAEENLGTKGIHLPLADLLLDEIPEDYKILVLPCAYGGTGFTSGQPGRYLKEELRPEPGIFRWGVKSPYYLGMKDRIAYMLDENSENCFLGVVWIQGEQDWQDARGHMAGFDAMTADFLEYFRGRYPGRVYKGDWNRDVWYNVETVSHWYSQGECPLIWEHYLQWNPRTYVEIPRDTDSNEVNGTGLTASIRGCHFGNNAYVKVVGPRVARQMITNRSR
ncbi:MAG: hypothetical protein Q4D16_23225 [Eubacteriales bacterium]|nr:hypothetical protein [Eubacteriales bacterium]